MKQHLQNNYEMICQTGEYAMTNLRNTLKLMHN